jgi:DNA-binding GntR family transcriptional regulator
VCPAPTHLQHVSLREQALTVIRQGLITGDIVPGEIYSASALAEQLGVSNSPVREAMLSLVNEGLMEAVRNRGFRVVPLSDADRQNIYDLRVMLEVPAMRRVAERGVDDADKARFQELAAQVTRSEEARDIVGYLEADRQLHLGLIDLLGNKRLTRLVERLRDQTRLYGLKDLAEQGLLHDSAEEHLPILAAVAVGDTRLAEELTTAHLEHIQGDWARGPAATGADTRPSVS